MTFACKLAIEYRQKFNRDIVIDMWCYRRFGHNEGDEPSFTQPLMYQEIRQHPPISELYAARLEQRGRDRARLGRRRGRRLHHPARRRVRGGQILSAQQGRLVRGRLVGPRQAAARRSPSAATSATGVDEETVREIGKILTTVPADVAVHKTLARIIDAAPRDVRERRGLRLGDRRGARLRHPAARRPSGAPLRPGFSGRGTFSQRHSVWVDQTNGAKYIPLTQVGPARFEVRDSPLSEFGVLGFEYGWSLADPQTLVLWEAQFGDFANGAQVIIDQFIAAGEAKWLRASGLVLLLPHGYEGQGPEHSSARPERFLQLCAEDNMQVANCTTPANYFHLLRRQMHRDFRKPLVIMTPKSLLRHKMAVSSLADFTGESHFRRILSDPNPPKDKDVQPARPVHRQARLRADRGARQGGDKNTSIVRIEQLYPFPGEALLARLKRMTNLEEVVWAQEEPKNQGYWAHVEPRIERRLGEAGLKPKRPIYAGREAAASPATGLAKRHAAEQAALIADALGHSSARNARRGKRARHGDRSQSPDAGRIDHRGDARRLAEAAGRGGRAGRADRQPGDRQGRDRGQRRRSPARWASSWSRSATRSRSAR